MTSADEARTQAVSPVLMALGLKAPAEPPASSFAPAPASAPTTRIPSAPSKNFRCSSVWPNSLSSRIVAMVHLLFSLHEFFGTDTSVQKLRGGSAASFPVLLALQRIPP